MHKTILKVHTALRSYCIERMTQMHKQQILTQTKAALIKNSKTTMTYCCHSCFAIIKKLRG